MGLASPTLPLYSAVPPTDRPRSHPLYLPADKSGAVERQGVGGEGELPEEDRRHCEAGHQDHPVGQLGLWPRRRQRWKGTEVGRKDGRGSEKLVSVFFASTPHLMHHSWFKSTCITLTLAHILCTNLEGWSLCQASTPSWFQPIIDSSELVWSQLIG